MALKNKIGKEWSHLPAQKGQAGLVFPYRQVKESPDLSREVRSPVINLSIITRSKLVTSPSRLTSAASNWNSFKTGCPGCDPIAKMHLQCLHLRLHRLLWRALPQLVVNQKEKEHTSLPETHCLAALHFLQHCHSWFYTHGPIIVRKSEIMVIFWM